MEIADEHVCRTFLPDIPNPKLTGWSDSFCKTAALLLLDRSSFPMHDMVEGAFFASAFPNSGRINLDEENCSIFEVDDLPRSNLKLE